LSLIVEEDDGADEDIPKQSSIIRSARLKLSRDLIVARRSLQEDDTSINQGSSARSHPERSEEYDSRTDSSSNETAMIAMTAFEPLNFPLEDRIADYDEASKSQEEVQSQALHLVEDTEEHKKGRTFARLDNLGTCELGLSLNSFYTSSSCDGLDDSDQSSETDFFHV